MVKRRCPGPNNDGCPHNSLTERTRCRACHNQANLARGYTTAYKTAHTQARAMLRELVHAGTTCSRCGQPILPTDPWDADQRPTGWHPSHTHCNRSAGAQHIA